MSKIIFTNETIVRHTKRQRYLADVAYQIGKLGKPTKNFHDEIDKLEASIGRIQAKLEAAYVKEQEEHNNA